MSSYWFKQMSNAVGDTYCRSREANRTINFKWTSQYKTLEKWSLIATVWTLQFQAFCPIKIHFFSCFVWCFTVKKISKWQQGRLHSGDSEGFKHQATAVGENITERSCNHWARLYKVTSIRVWLHVEEGRSSCPAGERRRRRTHFVSAMSRRSGSESSPYLDFPFVLHSDSCTCTFEHVCTAASGRWVCGGLGNHLSGPPQPIRTFSGELLVITSQWKP